MAIVPLQEINRNQRFSIVNTLREMERIYKNEIIIPLSRQHTTFFDINVFISEMPKTLKKIIGVLEDHAKSLIDLQVQKYERHSTLNQLERAQLWAKLMSQSWYKSALEKFHKRLKIKVYEFLISDNQTNSQATVIFREALRDIGMSEFHSMRRILLTESQTILNNTLEAVYEKEEHELGVKYNYRWQTAKDNRLTPYCKEILRRVAKLEGNRGHMVILKRIVAQVSNEMMGDEFLYRDWTPHYNCRSTFVRVVL